MRSICREVHVTDCTGHKTLGSSIASWVMTIIPVVHRKELPIRTYVYKVHDGIGGSCTSCDRLVLVESRPGALASSRQVL